MDTLSIQNFRSFRSKAQLEILPLTILLGKNGAGKSSLIRLFPMLKQTVESNATSFLWFGKYVDYGSFQEIQSKISKDETVDFELTHDLDKIAYPPHYLFRRANIKSIKGKKLRLRYSISKREKFGTFIRQMSVDDYGITINFDSDSRISNVIVNGFDCTKYLDIFQASNSLFPAFRPIYYYETSDVLRVRYKELHKKMFGSLRKDFLETSNLFSAEFSSFNKFMSKYKKFLLKKKSNDFDLAESLNELWALFVCRNIPDFFLGLESIFYQQYANVRYTAPVRADIERFYRHQELSVQEVDPKGTNIAIFLSKLSKTELQKFNAWTTNSLGFAIYSKPSEHHIELFIKLESGEECNLADTGFGYSQILPVLVQIWSVISKDKTRNRERSIHRRSVYSGSNDILIVIEQPELHLHPHFQSQLAHVFVNALAEASKAGIRLRFVLETHSEPFINTLSEIVRNKGIQPKKISLNFIEKEKLESSIRKVEFDLNGKISDWPIGFFS